MLTNIEPAVARIETPAGAMLVDPALLGRASDAAAEAIFDPAYWQARGEISQAVRGRGATWFISAQVDEWALRHYRRGGLITPLMSLDRYFWAGESAVRSFAEWRLLAELHGRGLPVPQPIAARYVRTGLTYSCDLIMRRIREVVPLSTRLADAPLPTAGWHAIGSAIAQLHAAGVDHADLNAHNILLGAEYRVSIIDFDRGRIRPRGVWQQGNLRRLQRSLRKISPSLPAQRITAQSWDALRDGYRDAARL
jgi:3-deoxy-D-manno-octulosonic acid kinase